MPQIKILPTNLANKIAAGEVVERPSSVVKELVENALDAKSRNIAIEIEDGGRKMIRVADDGVGMDSEDAKLAFARHATSKITEASDLFAINTLGFRGEALASIASVAKVSLSTKLADSISGTKIVADYGKVKSFEDAGLAAGTIVEVGDIFYNVPARKKYLKAKNTEFGHIVSAVTDHALSHPFIGFKLSHNKKIVLNLPRKQKFLQRVENIFGKDVSGSLLEIRHESPYIRIFGYIGKPEIARNSRDHQFIFVNKRKVQNSTVSHAVVEGFATFLQKNQYPVFFLFVELNPDLVDVNVHPQKREVRFLNQNMVHSAVLNSVRKVLSKEKLAPRIDLGGREHVAA
ncbi:MAG: hypothetical protein ACD_63C00001G0001, partial [uncultured bacterium]